MCSRGTMTDNNNLMRRACVKGQVSKTMASTRSALLLPRSETATAADLMPPKAKKLLEIDELMCYSSNMHLSTFIV